MIRHPRPGLAHLVIMIVMAVSVIVGLLAMHTIVSAPGDHNEPVSTMAVEMNTHGGAVALVNPDSAGTPGSCSGMCDPGHVMGNMACVLALLFGGLVLTNTASRQWSMFFAPTHSLWRAIPPAACLALPPPPDLNALSISRT